MHPTNADSLTEYLKLMKPGDTLSLPRPLNITDEYGNHIDLRNSKILCRKRHSTKKNPAKIKQPGYRFEVFTEDSLGEGVFSKILPVIATLKLNEVGKIELIKKESVKQRVVKSLHEPLRPEETLMDVNLPYLHMKQVIKDENIISYIVMRKVPGKTLEELLANRTILNLPEASKILLIIRILEAIQELHDLGVVHKDPNTQNIMIHFEEENSNPQVIMIDFDFSSLSLCRDDLDIDFHKLSVTLQYIYQQVKVPALYQLIQNTGDSSASRPFSLKTAIDELRVIYLSLLDTKENTPKLHEESMLKTTKFFQPIVSQTEEQEQEEIIKPSVSYKL